MIRRCAFLLLLGVLALLTYDSLSTDVYRWDLTVTERVQSVGAERFAPSLQRLSGVAVMVEGALAILAVVAWLWFKGWRTEAFCVILVGILDLFNLFIRDLIARPRPTSDLVFVLSDPQYGYSFPSGSAMHIAMFGGIIIYFSRYVVKPGRLRTALWVLVSLCIAAVGVWLVYAGRHWPSCVLGGYVYGAFFLWVLLWGYHKYVAWRRAYPKGYIPKEKLPALARPFAWIMTTIY